MSSAEIIRKWKVLIPDFDRFKLDGRLAPRKKRVLTIVAKNKRNLLTSKGMILKVTLLC